MDGKVVCFEKRYLNLIDYNVFVNVETMEGVIKVVDELERTGLVHGGQKRFVVGKDSWYNFIISGSDVSLDEWILLGVGLKWKKIEGYSFGENKGCRIYALSHKAKDIPIMEDGVCRGCAVYVIGSNGIQLVRSKVGNQYNVVTGGYDKIIP